MRRQITREDGFALPLTIFVLAIITIMLAAIFVRVQIDRRVAESSGDMVDALTIAQSGLYQYLDYYSTLNTRPADGDSVEFTSIPPGGKASVVARIVQNPADTLKSEIYIIRSTGIRIKPALGPEPQARRTVAQFAQWQTGSIELLAAFTAANGFRARNPSSSSGSVDIRGVDQCPGSPAPTVTGLKVDNGGTNLAWPDVDPAPVESLPPTALANATGIDWNAVVNGGFSPDYTTLTNLNSWSSYLIQGDTTLGGVTGNGLLIVTGDLDLTGLWFTWAGVVLVGGRIVFEPTNAGDPQSTIVRGAVVSGLNAQLGPAPPSGETGPPLTSITIHHYSCMVDSALASLTGFVAIPNAWMDNWAEY